MAPWAAIGGDRGTRAMSRPAGTPCAPRRSGRAALARQHWDYVVLQQGPSSRPASQTQLREWAKRWADEARAQSPAWLANEVVTHLEAHGCHRVYVTNDIDGTDAHWAGACGTPEPNGLSPEAVLAVYDAIRSGPFEVLGADLVEVAPGLSLDPEASARTVATAARYARASLALFPFRE